MAGLWVKFNRNLASIDGVAASHLMGMFTLTKSDPSIYFHFHGITFLLHATWLVESRPRLLLSKEVGGKTPNEGLGARRNNPTTVPTLH